MSRKKEKNKGKAVIRRPELVELSPSQVTDKYSDYPSNGLTPEKLASILREGDGGDVLRQSELFEEMEEKDPHLFSQLQTRKQQSLQMIKGTRLEKSQEPVINFRLKHS